MPSASTAPPAASPAGPPPSTATEAPTSAASPAPSAELEAARRAPVSPEAFQAVKKDLEELEAAYARTQAGTGGNWITDFTTKEGYGEVMRDIGKQVDAARSAFDRFAAKGSLTQLEHDELRIRLTGAQGMFADPAKLRSDTVATAALGAVGLVGAGLMAAPAVVGGGLAAAAAKLGGALGVTSLAANWAMEGENYTGRQAVADVASGALQGATQVVGGAVGGRALGALGGLATKVAPTAVPAALGYVEGLAAAAPLVAKAGPLAMDAVKGALEGSVGGAAGAGLSEALRPETWKDGALEGAKRVLDAAGHGATVGAVAGGIARPAVGALQGRPAPAEPPSTPSAAQPPQPPVPATAGSAAAPAVPATAGSASAPAVPATAGSTSAPPGRLAGLAPRGTAGPPPSAVADLSQQEQQALAAARRDAFGPQSHPDLAGDFALVQRLEDVRGARVAWTREKQATLDEARARIEQERGRVLAAPLGPAEQATVLQGRVRALDPRADVALRADVARVAGGKPVGVSARVLAERAVAKAEAQGRIDAAKAELLNLRAQVAQVYPKPGSPERVRLLASVDGALRALGGGSR